MALFSLPPSAAVGSDRIEPVVVQICENGLPQANAWPDQEPLAKEEFEEVAFALFRIPRKYNDQGVRQDWSNPLLLRAEARVAIPAGEHRLLLRSRRAARLWIDGELVAENDFPQKITDGHDPVERPYLDLAPNLRFAIPGDQESVVDFSAPGVKHDVRLETFAGGFAGKSPLRPELGETSVSISFQGDETFWLLSPARKIRLTDDGWNTFRQERTLHYDLVDTERRRAAQEIQKDYWHRRHQYAREVLASREKPEIAALLGKNMELPPVDRILAGLTSKEGQSSATSNDVSGDLAFLRRIHLDIVGQVPTPEEVQQFLNDDTPKRRKRLIDRLLEDDRWADHWVGYWQDALAENPTIVNPTLNNTGPFRWWIYESFLDNKPMDRFVTELVMMSGSPLEGGPAGFSMASQNDVPMGAKAGILATAFLAVEMKCSRCHDAPYHENTQEDLFQFASMLAQQPLEVPASSSVPKGKLAHADRPALIEVTLQPGTKVAPAWPFSDISDTELPREFDLYPEDARSRLAWRIVSPHNQRFAAVVVNRLWSRCMGEGIVEPIDDWEEAEPSHELLLEFLAREFATHSFDLKHVARLIFNSRAYQDAGRRGTAEGERRRMTAEQIIDSLFLSFGKELRTEELNIDLTGGRPWGNAMNLGLPRRAWQFGGMANNRDRPSLTLPRAQSVIDVMAAFGWRPSRQEPTSYRKDSLNVLQPAILANGTVGRWLTTLSDDHEITQLCLQEQPLSVLIDQLYLRILTRRPRPQEAERLRRMLAEGYETRQRAATRSSKAPGRQPPPLFVTWANHLEPAATTIKLSEERAAREGDPPTERLDSDWRQRMEDVLWVLLNLPETIHY